MRFYPVVNRYIMGFLTPTEYIGDGLVGARVVRSVAECLSICTMQ
jgi:hypothetical protein